MDLSSKGQFSQDDLARIRSISYQVTGVLQRKQVEKEVQLQLQRMHTLNNIERAVSSSLNINLSLNILVSEMLSQVTDGAISVLLLNPVSQSLEYFAGKGFQADAFRYAQVRLGEGLAGRVGLDRKSIHRTDLSSFTNDFPRGELFESEGFVEYYGIPLIAKGVLKGVLELFLRVHQDADLDWINYLETLGGQTAIAIDNAQLFQDLQRSNMELVAAYDATIAGWSRAMDLRDKETEGHTMRVTELTVQLAEKMGYGAQDIVHLRRGALLHDIGKLGVPDHLLFKPGKLTEDEWKIMRMHPVFAFNMLIPIAYLRQAIDVPYSHHEKWDGSGYPRGLKGEQIPLAARMFAVIDVWDALRSDRPYRSSWSEEQTRAYILEQAGKHFDPQVVKAFLEMLDEQVNGSEHS